MQTTRLDQNENIYTVSRLNNEVRLILEDTFPFVWVEGEISNFAAPNSGHWYFSLKDSGAQVRCAMFRMHQRKLNFTPKDGMHVLLKARVSLYENRGEFQLIAENMEERGEGKLKRAYEALKKKLEAAGLFDTARKKPIPSFPKQIGIITSATGAAIRDILIVLRRRYASLPVIIYPTLVQGSTAAPTIVKAIEIANQRNECDVLILARGGGSLEDLWPFNEEAVAHAIYNSRLPIISGIGHEIDFTIADFVADKRAPTPSAAAEIATPDTAELFLLLSRYKQQVTRCMVNKIKTLNQQLGWIHKNLSQQHPRRKLQEKIQQLDFFELSLVQLQTKKIHGLLTQLKTLDGRLQKQVPLYRIQQLQHRLQLCQEKFQNFMQNRVKDQQTQLANLAAKLDALSPLATLQRGYAIASHNHHVLQKSSDVKIGDQVHLKLASGALECKVMDIIE